MPKYNKEHPWSKAARYNKRRKVFWSTRQRLFYSTKTSARERGLDHTITLDDINIPEFCPYLGHKLAKGGIFPNSPSVDRIDTTKGYVAGNVQVISFEANQLKSDMSSEEWEDFILFYQAEQEYEQNGISTTGL